MIVIALFTSLTLSVMGLYCLLSPKEIQGYALKHSAENWLKSSSLEWMKTPRYLLYVRLMGGTAFAVGTAATVILAIEWFKLWFI